MAAESERFACIIKNASELLFLKQVHVYIETVLIIKIEFGKLCYVYHNKKQFTVTCIY